MREVGFGDFEVSETLDVTGTCLQGYVLTTYEELVEHFGAPARGSHPEVDVEWRILFHRDGSIVTVYNWVPANGKLSAIPHEQRRWHIGGFDRWALRHMANELGRICHVHSPLNEAHNETVTR